MRLLCILLLIFLPSCNSRRHPINVSAPVTTVVYFDDFKEEERKVIQEIVWRNIQLVNLTFSISIDVEVNVTKDKITPRWNGRKLLLWCGERNNLPDLYDELYKKAKKDKKHD